MTTNEIALELVKIVAPKEPSPAERMQIADMYLSFLKKIEDYERGGA